MITVERFRVVRDCGFGQVFVEVFNTETEAQTGLVEWQDPQPNGLINGGVWTVRKALYEVWPGGAEFFLRYLDDDG